MSFYKVTNIKTGDSSEFEFNGTAHQFVRFYGKGRGYDSLIYRNQEISALSAAVTPETKSTKRSKTKE